MNSQLELERISIVVLGNFNPAIFHPSWFEYHNLLGKEESKNAEIDVVHPSASNFTAEWVSINVIRERFQVITTKASYYEALRDLVVGVLELLEHTPLGSMGINRDMHYRMSSKEKWHLIGDKLAPKEFWNGLLESPGMRNLTLEGKRTDDFAGYIRVRVEPSNKIEHGVFISVNDHYEVKEDDENRFNTLRFQNILREKWQRSLKKSLEISERLIRIGGLNDS